MISIKADLDIIIPCYNAKETLFNTLASISIQKSAPKFKVYLINDKSDYDYQDEINNFSDVLDIEEIKLDTNLGPGGARREGINRSNSDYMMFIDSDDLLYNCYSVRNLYQAVQGYDLCISDFIFERDGVRVVKQRNKIWLHGKIYKRSFLEQYNINFNDTRANEDNGFNRLVLLMNPKIKYLNKITYVYRENSNSITRANNREYMISGLEGFAFNMKWAMDEALKRGADKEVISMLSTSVLVSMYYDFLYTINESNNKDILKYSKIIMPYYLEYDKVSNDFLDSCFKYKEGVLEEEDKHYDKVVTFDEFIRMVQNYD